MKSFKKFAAMFITVAMMLSLVVVPASAAASTDCEITFVLTDASGETVTTVKEGDVVNVAAYATPGYYPSFIPWFNVNANVTYSDITSGIRGYNVNMSEQDGTPVLKTSGSDKEPTANEPIFTLVATIGAVTPGPVTILSVHESSSITNEDNARCTITGEATVTAVEAAVISEVEGYADVTGKEVGTTVTELALPAELTVKTADKDSAKGAKVKVTWDTSNYDSLVMTEQTITGTVDTGNEFWTLSKEFVQPVVKVTLKAIVGAKENVDVTTAVGDIRKVETALTGDDLKAAVAAALVNVTKLTVTKGDVTDTVSVTWDGTVTEGEGFAGATGLDKTATIEGSLASASDKGYFTFAEGVTATGTVTVIPATIDNASIAIKNNSIYAIPQITITVPAKEIKPDNVVTEGEGEGATEVSRTGVNEIKVTLTQESGDPIVLTASALKYNDFTFSGEGDDAVATYTVTGVKSLNKLGVESGEDVTISATLNKAELVVGTEDVTDEEGKVTGTKDVTSVGITASKPISGSAAGIKPGASINNNSQNNQTGTTTPGTETPGTETPGTETPGTETPGTDAPVVEGLFEDVAADHWAAEAIATLKDAGIVGGVTATTFAPDADITRAEFTKMIAGLLKLDATSTEVAFEDCGADDWFTPYVAAAVEAGLVTGVSETEFAPDATITREQAFTIIGRAIAAAEVNTTLTYADAAEISEYAVPYVTLLTQEGIVGGFADNTVRPQANITRAEAAKVIAGLMGIVVTEEEVAEEEAVDQTEEATTEEEAAEEETVEEETVEE